MSDFILVTVSVVVACLIDWLVIAAAGRWIEGKWLWSWPVEMFKEIIGKGGNYDSF